MKKYIIYILSLLSLTSCNDLKETSPQPDPEDIERPLKIAFITDTHYGTSGNNSYTRRCIADINSLDSVDFVLMGGDLTNVGSDVQIAGAKSAFDDLNRPYWVVSGNHDSKWSESGCTTFPKTIGYDNFDFKAGGYRFIGCESGPDMRMGNALVSVGSMKWLKSLKREKPAIFLNHYPLDETMSNSHEVRKELIRLDCRLAIAGHVHTNGKRNYDGLPGFTGTTSNGVSEYARYNIITIRDGIVKVSERRVYEDHAITGDPWFTTELRPVTDNMVYDTDGLPENYQYFAYSDNDTYPQVQVLWNKVEDSNIGSGFAIDDDTAWYATASGKVVSIDLKNGNTLWTRSFDGKIYSTPAVSDNTLVFACTDGYIYALDSSNGNTLWEFSVGKAVASPAIKDGAVYFGNGVGSFWCLNLKDGKKKWSYTGVAGFCDAAPFVDDSQVVFGSWGGTLYSLDKSTGTRQWEWYREGGILTSPGACPPLKSGNRIFIACPDRHTYCIDAKTGELLFLIDDGRESIALSEDKKTLFIKSMSGKALAVNAEIMQREVTGAYAPDSPSTGYWQPAVPVLQSSQTLWYVDSGLEYDIATSALSECGGMLLMPSARGCIHALDAATGAPLWIHKVGLGMTNPVTTWKEENNVLILASTTDGKIELLKI